jgi:ATP/maltotriose-dependent transcriptional regulator MalT
MDNAIPPYGVAIHQAIAAGDADRMRALVTETETYLRNASEAGAALETLKAELRKLDAGRS